MHTNYKRYLYLSDKLRDFSHETVDKNTEEPALAVFWVTDGVDRCQVGFLPRHYLKRAEQLDGSLAQITQVFSESELKTDRARSRRNMGSCRAALI